MVGPYIKLGSNFHAKVKLENTSNETRKIKGNITVSSFFYTGVLAHQIVKKPVKIEIPAGSTEILEITVTYKEYAPKLVDQCHMNVNAMMLVDQTDQLVFFNESYELGKPELLIKAPVKGKVEVPLDVEVSFRNPLNITLTGCELRVEGPGITKELVIKQRNVIPGETFAYSMRLAPRSKGNRAIYMNFSCEQIVGIHGTHFIEIA